MPINTLYISDGDNEKRFTFETPGEAGEIYKKIIGKFPTLSNEEVSEAFRNKKVLRVTIYPIKQPGDSGIGAGIMPETYYSLDLYEQIVEFAEKEYELSKK